MGISLIATIACLAVTAVGVLVFLHALGSFARRERQIHDLRAECLRLRNNYVRRLFVMSEGDLETLEPAGEGEFDLID